MAALLPGDAHGSESAPSTTSVGLLQDVEAMLRLGKTLTKEAIEEVARKYSLNPDQIVYPTFADITADTHTRICWSWKLRDIGGIVAQFQVRMCLL